VSGVKYTSVKLYLVLNYTVNIGGGLCSEWEKYTSVKLYLVLSYTVNTRYNFTEVYFTPLTT
jgi:hypothetical protein